MAAQGPTREEAKRRFLRTLAQQIVCDLLEEKDPLADLEQAPPRYFEESVTSRQAGPELPVYVPVQAKRVPRVTATARFLEQPPAAG